MKVKLSINLLFFYFLLIFLLSPAIQSTGIGSTSYGIFFSSIVIILSYSFLSAQHKSSLSGLSNSAGIAFLFVTFILFHGLVVSFLNGYDISFLRLVISCVITSTIVISSYIFSSMLKSTDSKKFKLVMRSIITLMLILIPAIILRYSAIFSEIKALFYSADNILDYIVIFAEPSHYVLAFLPIYLYKIIIGTPIERMLLIIFGFVFIILVKSLTLLIFILGILFLIVSARPKILIYVLFLLLISIFLLWITSFNVPNLRPEFYIFNKLDGILLPSLSTNLSALTFIADWHEAYLNMLKTNGMGIGFQQIGVAGERSFTKSLVYENSGTFAWNIKFESFSVLPKLISEFGIFAFIFLLVYIKYFLISFTLLRKNLLSKVSELDYKMVLINCFIVCFAVNLFVRGTGYFTTSSFFFVVAFFYLSSYKRKDT